jgi:hypothetical protein
VAPEVYLEPKVMAEMAYKEEAKFMKLCKENHINQFIDFHGVDCTAEFKNIHDKRKGT